MIKTIKSHTHTSGFPLAYFRFRGLVQVPEHYAAISWGRCQLVVCEKKTEGVVYTCYHDVSILIVAGSGHSLAAHGAHACMANQPSLGFHCTWLLLKLRFICFWGRSLIFATDLICSWSTSKILNTARNQKSRVHIYTLTNITRIYIFARLQRS